MAAFVIRRWSQGHAWFYHRAKLISAVIAWRNKCGDTQRRENLRSVPKTDRIVLDVSSQLSRTETAWLRIYVNAIQVWFDPPQRVGSSRADTLAAQDVQQHITPHLRVGGSKLISCSQVVWRHRRPGQLDLRELWLGGSSSLTDLTTPDSLFSSISHYPFSLFTPHLYIIFVFCRKMHHFCVSFRFWCALEGLTENNDEIFGLFFKLFSQLVRAIVHKIAQFSEAELSHLISLVLQWRKCYWTCSRTLHWMDLH